MEAGSPLILLLVPIVAAVVALLIRARRRATALVGLGWVVLLTILLALATPGIGLFADNSLTTFGREFVLTPFVRSLFLFIYPAMGVLFAYTWFHPSGRALVPAGLAVLSPMAAALMITPAALGVAFIVATAAVSIPVLFGGRFDAARAAWRYFLLAAAGMAPMLLALSAPAGSAGASSWHWPLIALLIWLGSFPFHIWVTGLGRHASTTALTLMLALVQIGIVVYLFTALDAVPAARASAQFQAAVRWSASLTALIAAFQMARATDQRGVLTGLLLLDLGLLPLAALSPSSDGLLIALPALIGRFLSLMLITTALAVVPVDGDSTRAARWNALLRPGILLYACLSLIGLPLTPGFSGRWAQVAVAGQGASPWPVVLILFAMAVSAIAMMRALPFLAATDQTPQQGGRVVPKTETIYLLFLIGAAILTGLLPGLLTDLAARMLGLV